MSAPPLNPKALLCGRGRLGGKALFCSIGDSAADWVWFARRAWPQFDLAQFALGNYRLAKTCMWDGAMPLMTAADCVAFCFLVASAVAVAMAIWIPRSKLWKGLPAKPENRLEPKESDQR